MEKWVHKGANGAIDAVYHAAEDVYLRTKAAAGSWPDDYKLHVPRQNLRLWSAAQLKAYNLYRVTRDAAPAYDAATQRLELTPVAVGGTSTNETWTVRAATAQEIAAWKRAQLADTDRAMPRVTEDLIDALTAKGLISPADLPQASRDKLARRKELRQ